MKKILALAAISAAIVAPLALAGPAAADTITGDPCAFENYAVPDGWTVVLPLSTECGNYVDAVVREGAPTIVVQRATDGSPLVWLQAVGRASADAVCEEGWNPSWAQWMNEGTGGYTCERTIVWGTLPGQSGDAVYVTINAPEDWAELLYEGSDPFVNGCATPQRGSYTLVNNCPDV